MQAHDILQQQGKPKGQQYKVVHLKAEVIDFFLQVITEAEFNTLLLISALFIAATCFANMTPEAQDKCGSLQNPALIILAKLLLTRRQHHKTGQVI